MTNNQKTNKSQTKGSENYNNNNNRKRNHLLSSSARLCLEPSSSLSRTRIQLMWQQISLASTSGMKHSIIALHPFCHNMSRPTQKKTKSLGFVETTLSLQR